jgi:hypothetical protein
MQTFTTAFSSGRPPSAAKQRSNTKDDESRVSLNRALLDAVAWNTKSHARRKRLGLE